MSFLIPGVVKQHKTPNSFMNKEIIPSLAALSITCGRIFQEVHAVHEDFCECTECHSSAEVLKCYSVTVLYISYVGRLLYKWGRSNPFDRPSSPPKSGAICPMKMRNNVSCLIVSSSCIWPWVDPFTNKEMVISLTFYPSESLVDINP